MAPGEPHRSDVGHGVPRRPDRVRAATALAGLAGRGDGGFRRRRGPPVAGRSAGLALTAASWAGLVGLDRVAARADDVLEAALVEGLGPDYRRRMAATFAPPEDVPITRRQVANPLPPLRRRYATTRDVPYGERGRRNHLDLWRRADLPATPAPPCSSRSTAGHG